MDDPAALSEDQVRQLLRECVTVVKPGEVLVIQMPWDLPAAAVYEFGERVHAVMQDMSPAIHTAVSPAVSLGVVEAPGG